MKSGIGYRKTVTHNSVQQIFVTNSTSFSIIKYL